MTENELRELSEKATDGPWTVTDYGTVFVKDQWIVSTALLYSSVEVRANAAFIVALVNAYREGHLVWREEEE